MKGPESSPSTPHSALAEAANLRQERPDGRAKVKNIFWESVLVAVLGAAFAFAANEVSPRGLKLTQDYFPGATRSLRPVAVATNLTPHAGLRTGVTSAVELLSLRLQAKGLHLVKSNEVAQLFRDPRYAQELFVFIDARDDRHYQEGHIPGAYQFDHYRADKYLATVLPVCQTAEQIVVYCNGGDCEDSEFAAVTLRSTGIPTEKLFIYGGGFLEWMANELPVETGARKSGNLRPNKK